MTTNKSRSIVEKYSEPKFMGSSNITDDEVTHQAKKLGLEHKGHGLYGPKGNKNHITHKAVGNVLIPVNLHKK